MSDNNQNMPGENKVGIMKKVNMLRREEDLFYDIENQLISFLP